MAREHTDRSTVAALPPIPTVDANVLDNLVTDKQIEAYVAWRHALATGRRTR